MFFALLLIDCSSTYVEKHGRAFPVRESKSVSAELLLVELVRLNDSFEGGHGRRNWYSASQRY